jgi:hypothetical protein
MLVNEHTLSAGEMVAAFATENGQRMGWRGSSVLGRAAKCSAAATSRWAMDSCFRIAANFASHPKPKSPRNLANHRCLSFRLAPDERYRWEFRKGKQSVAVALNGPLIANDLQLMTRAALDGVGLA